VEAYPAIDCGEKFGSDAVRAWNKDMKNDSFDLRAVQSTNAGDAAR